MGRFNQAVETPKTATVNLAGGTAYTETPELELASIVLTSFVQDQFYRSAEDTMQRLRELICAVSPEFAAKAALYARYEFNMRSITHVMGAELAHRHKGLKWMRQFISKLVRRPDDITEMLAYSGVTYGKPLPNSLRAGLARAFGKFNAYALAKYRGEGKMVSLIDAVRLCHPKPTEGNAEALALLVKGELKETDTWEARQSAAGDDKEKKAAEWADLLRQGKLGYMALIRNLRNILKDAPDLIDLACEQIVDPERVHKSRMLPFRFATAAEMLTKEPGSTSLLAALSAACDIACDNVPTMEGRTLVAVDVSSSMTYAHMSTHSKAKPATIASLFGAILERANDADLIVFETRAKYLTVMPGTPVLVTAQQIMEMGGGGTSFEDVFAIAAAKNRDYARIIILSDMQAWAPGRQSYTRSTGPSTNKAFNAYKAQVGCNPHVFSVDLQGYGSLQFPEPQVYALAGFSERMFDIMAMLEKDRNALVRTIEAVALP